MTSGEEGRRFILGHEGHRVSKRAGLAYEGICDNTVNRKHIDH